MVHSFSRRRYYEENVDSIDNYNFRFELGPLDFLWRRHMWENILLLPSAAKRMITAQSTFVDAVATFKCALKQI